MKNLYRKLVYIFMLVISAVSFAEVKTELSAFKITSTKEGKLEKTKVENISPGETIVYSFVMLNEDAQAVKNLSPVIPVPQGTTLIPDSITPAANAKVTVNGRDFSVYPILGEDKKPVPDSEYRAVTWNIAELKGNAEAKVELSVRVNN